MPCCSRYSRVQKCSYTVCLIVSKLDAIVYADDVLVSLEHVHSQSEHTRAWYEGCVNIRKLQGIELVILSVLCLDLLWPSYIISKKAGWAARRFVEFCARVACPLMRGDSLQISALARERAALKGRIDYLWANERARRCRRGRDTVFTPQDPELLLGPSVALGNSAFCIPSRLDCCAAVVCQ